MLVTHLKLPMVHNTRPLVSHPKNRLVLKLRPLHRAQNRLAVFLQCIDVQLTIIPGKVWVGLLSVTLEYFVLIILNEETHLLGLIGTVLVLEALLSTWRLALTHIIVHILRGMTASDSSLVYSLA